MKKLEGDPRYPELEADLRALPPAIELEYRLAMRVLSEFCAGDSRWNARVSELTQGYTTEQFAEALRAARRRRKELERLQKIGARSDTRR